MDLLQEHLSLETYITKEALALARVSFIVYNADMIMNKEMAGKTAKLRETGLSIREIARVLNTHKTQVHRWETYNKRDVDS